MTRITLAHLLEVARRGGVALPAAHNWLLGLRVRPSDVKHSGPPHLVYALLIADGKATAHVSHQAGPDELNVAQYDATRVDVDLTSVSARAIVRLFLAAHAYHKVVPGVFGISMAEPCSKPEAQSIARVLEVLDGIPMVNPAATAELLARTVTAVAMGAPVEAPPLHEMYVHKLQGVES